MCTSLALVRARVGGRPPRLARGEYEEENTTRVGDWDHRTEERAERRAASSESSDEERRAVTDDLHRVH